MYQMCHTAISHTSAINNMSLAWFAAGGPNIHQVGCVAMILDSSLE